MALFNGWSCRNSLECSLVLQKQGENEMLGVPFVTGIQNFFKHNLTGNPYIILIVALLNVKAPGTGQVQS